MPKLGFAPNLKRKKSKSACPSLCVHPEAKMLQKMSKIKFRSTLRPESNSKRHVKGMLLVTWEANLKSPLQELAFGLNLFVLRKAARHTAVLRAFTRGGMPMTRSTVIQTFTSCAQRSAMASSKHATTRQPNNDLSDLSLLDET